MGRFIKIFLLFSLCFIYYYEADSVLLANERTTILNQLKESEDNFTAIDTICRNIYINELRNSPDFVIDAGLYLDSLYKTKLNKKLIAWSRLLIGAGNNQTGNYIEALNNLEEALEHFRKISDFENIGNSYNQIAIVYLNQQNTKTAINYFTQALNIFEKNGFENKLTPIYNNIGLIYLKTNSEKALEYFRRSLENALKFKQEKQYIYAYINIGNAFSDLGNTDEAIKYLNMAYRENLKYENPYNSGHVNFSLGKVYKKIGETDKAIEYFENAHKDLELSHDHSTHIDLTYLLGECYYKNENYSKALFNYRHAYNLSFNQNIKSVPPGILKGLSLTFKNLKNYDSAYFYLSFYNYLKEDFFNQEIEKETQKLLFDFESQRKDLAMKNLLLEAESSKNKNKNLIIIFTISIALIIGILAVILFFNNRKNLKLSRRLQQEINTNKSYEEKLLEAKDRIEESNNFKTAIIRNMTHEIRTPFNGLLGFINLIKKRSKQINDEEMNEYAEYVELSGRRIYNLISNLYDLALLESNDYQIRKAECYLPDIIYDVYYSYLDTANAKGIDINIGHVSDLVFMGDSMAVSKAIKNVVDNSVKFTYKGSINISSIYQDGTLFIKIEDTGIGISKEDINNVTAPFKQADMKLARMHEGMGIGLSITIKILEKLNAKLEISSQENKGTTVTFKFHDIELSPDYEKIEN